MAASSVSKDMEALVDLFFSPAFDPFEPEVLPAAPEYFACGPNLVYEAAVDEDSQLRARTVVHNDAYTRRCGRTLANLGEDFYKSYKPKEKVSSTGPPWLSIGEKLRSIFNKVIQNKDKDPCSEEEAWSQFKEIMSQAVSDTPVADAYRQLGAVLLTLHGLSNLASGVRGLARVFFIRFIRERHLDAQIQNLGGLDHMMAQEVD